MLTKLKLLYPSADQEIISLLLDNATTYFLTYCNLEEVPEGAAPLLIRMVQEDMNKLYAEGYNSESVGGNSTAYETDYTPQLRKLLNKFKRIRTV